MTLEDPETTIERLYHAMYGNLTSKSALGSIPVLSGTQEIRNELQRENHEIHEPH
jgi:hypothetical protein